MLAGIEDREPPGWFGRTLSEAFNDRPRLLERGEGDVADQSDGADPRAGGRSAGAG
jgi:hypothetical protein